MSERSSTVYLDKEQISKTFGRSFIEVIENFIEENQRLDVIYTCAITFFNAFDSEGKSLILKKVLMHFLRKFPTDFENPDHATDYICKTLNLWRLFGKCSKTMGPIVILQKIEDSYADCWQYYQIYAETMIEEGQIDGDELYKTFKKCMENCNLTNEEVQKRFGTKVMSYVKFPQANEEDECTIQFMQVVRQNDIRKSLAARRRSSVAPSRLDIVLEKTDENLVNNSTKTAVSELGRMSIRSKSTTKSMQQIDENAELPSATQTSSQKANHLQKLAPAYHTPLSKQYEQPKTEPQISPVVDYQETMPTTTVYSQEMTTMRQSPPKDDFTVFKDPTIALKTTRSINVHQPQTPTTQSPISKRGRMNGFETQNEPRNDIYGKENNTFSQNSPTICGTHLHRKDHSFLTSTPEMNLQTMTKFSSTQKSHQKPIDFTEIGSPDPIDKQLMGSPDPVDKQMIEVRRRRTIGLFEKTPEFRQTAKSTTSTQQKPAPPKTSLDKLNSLTRNFNQIHLLNSQSDHEVTGNGSVSLLFVDGVLNPWNEEDRNAILHTSKFIQKRNNLTTQICPKIDKTQPFLLANKMFHPLKQIGEGGFARVFKCKYENKNVAVKYQRPGCPFEVHIIDLLQSVMPKNLKPFVMSIMDAFIYKDASVIVYEYLQYKTLLELSNTYRIHGADIHGGVVSLIGLQLGNVLQRIHQARVIHADLKPDNILICSQLPENVPIEKLIDFPLIRLIDFGRAIDMNYFNGKTFTGKAKTQCFDCVEMKEGRPWTYQTDFFGFIATIYILMHHQYMEIKMDGDRVKTKLSVKRRMVTSAVWVEIFDKFLNIPSCKEIPHWDPNLKLIKQELLNVTQSDAPTWKNALKTLNKMIQTNQEKN